ncbi:hypothetical protein NUH86_15545 [Sphingobium sp. JS3065]|uniref:hypothetical protein n=1 Tax=Sphingobium sp. JS3065 TaxID=2970925 RepID=UPI002264728D|nr:hypothetical protein [Sphingobium sp. JS3065]UZW56972.1 hypothetical protein NUH86_15545 [Sphingobium sp. JS3065]
MPGIACGAGGANRDMLLGTIDNRAGEMGSAQAHAALLQQDHQIVDQITDDLRDGLGGADGFEQPPLRTRRFERYDGNDRLGDQSTRLVQSTDGRQAHATGQGAARHGIKIGDPFKAEARRRQQRLGFQPQCR